MSDIALDENDIERLSRLAAVLIPGTARMPAVADVPDFDRLLRSAVKACGYADAELRAALNQIPANPDWMSVRAFADAQQARFDMAATLASGAYFMSPLVLERLGYPLERRHPAGIEDFANEYETGILDPVVARGPRFRDPRSAG